jgi:hypothetical protein
MSKLQDWVTGCLGLGKIPILRDQMACERLYFWAYLWPRMRQIIQPLPFESSFSSDFSRMNDPFDLECTMAILALGAEPDKRIRLRSTEKLRTELLQIVEELEREVEKIRSSEVKYKGTTITNNHH